MTVLTLGCGDPFTDPVARRAYDCAEPFDPAADPFPDRVEPIYAENFEVVYRGATKLVTIRNPWRGSKIEARYLLVQCGAPAPDPAAIPEGATVLRIPARRVVTTSTTELPHLEHFRLLDRLVGHDGFDYVYSPQVRSRIDDGTLVEVGNTSQINTEMLVVLDPDLIFAFTSGNPEYDVPVALRELELPVVLNASYMEATPLARSEWIKFTALFFNEEAAANRLFGEVDTHYHELSRLARAAERFPTVLAGAPFRGVWHVPGGRSYMATYLADAGADYLWREDDSTGSIPLGFESVWARGRNADVWLKPSYWRSLSEGLEADPRFAEFDPFRTGRVYNNNARTNGPAGNDYWETGSLRPDLVLADLIEILHPGLLPGHELVFYRRLPP